jgi:hypothetical protein
MRGVELALQSVDDLIGIDVVTCSPCGVAGAKPACDELSLHATALDSGPHRGFDELREHVSHGHTLRPAIQAWPVTVVDDESPCVNR